MPIDPKLGKARKGKQTQEDLKRDRDYAGKAPVPFGGVRGRYFGAPAPRTGGGFTSQGKPQGTSKRAPIRKAIKNIKKTSASPQAKKAAKRAYR